MLTKMKTFAKTMVRRKSPIIFGDLSRTVPISRTFGLDRGAGIPRRYIDRFIDRHANYIFGNALEVGEVRYLQKFTTVTHRSVLAPNQDAIQSGGAIDEILIADLSAPTSLPENKFDSFVCVQTLNFIFDFRAAIQGIHRLLTPGGYVVGTAAGICQISRYDMDHWGDYWRFTQKSLQLILGESLKVVEIVTMGNALAAQMILQGIAVEDLPDPSLLDEVDPDYPAVIGFVAVKC